MGSRFESGGEAEVGPGPARTLAIVLAAGSGSRFHGDDHKLHAMLGSRQIAGHAIHAAAVAAIGPVLVVTGAIDLAAALADLPPAEVDIEVVHNAAWARGQATSLQVACQEARRRGAEALVVGLADQPFVEPLAWRLVAGSESPIVIATYDGRRRNPVRLHRSVWPLLPADGDTGARALARMRPDLVQEVPCPGSAADIDTLEDLQSWQNRSSTNSP